jgi:hypothetical protein
VTSSVAVGVLNFLFVACCATALTRALVEKRKRAALLWGGFVALTEGFSATGTAPIAVLVFSGSIAGAGGIGTTLGWNFCWQKIRSACSKTSELAGLIRRIDPA